jgi:hypothetical protein
LCFIGKTEQAQQVFELFQVFLEQPSSEDDQNGSEQEEESASPDVHKASFTASTKKEKESPLLSHDSRPRLDGKPETVKNVIV